MNRLYVRQISLQKSLPPDSYLCHLPAIRHLQTHPLCFDTPVTFLVGENGTGKSTLVESLAIAMQFNPEGGSRNFCFSTEDSHSPLSDLLTVVKGAIPPRDGFFLRAESFYNVASYIDQLDRQVACAPPVIDSYGGVSLHRQSHGESFMALVEQRFGAQGLYILDEPEAALSPMRLMRLLYHIDRLSKQNCQWIISTHSPILMSFPNAKVYQLSKSGIQEVDYRQTEAFCVTKAFMNDPNKMLQRILEDDQ